MVKSFGGKVENGLALWSSVWAHLHAVSPL